MKKIAIIGRGTAGVLSAAHFSKYCGDCEIELYYDSNIKPQPVGEGSNLTLSKYLFDILNFKHSELPLIDGTFKTGVKKIGWGEGKDFEHEVTPPHITYHFNAAALQEYIINKLKDRIKIYDKNVSPDDIDSDYVMDCSGTPKNLDEFIIPEFITVNSVYVTQCYWDYPKFLHTLSITRPYGWVFGIPLKNRCAIGYVYNNNINTLQQVQEDVKNIFDEYKLMPSDKNIAFSFKSYYRKNNFQGRVVYNGNSSFFLEPLEATSISVIEHINRYSYDIWFDNNSIVQKNNDYKHTLQRIESMILMHYYSGSPYKTAFWHFAQDRGRKCIENSLEKHQELKLLIEKPYSDIDPNLFTKDRIKGYGPGYGLWGIQGMHLNFNKLGLYDKLKKDFKLNPLNLGYE